MRIYTRTCDLQGIAIGMDIVLNHAGENNLLKNFDAFEPTDTQGAYFYDGCVFCQQKTNEW